MNGMNGTSCTITTADGGGRLLACTDGTSIALPSVTDAGSPGDFLKISFNVKVDGVNDNRFTSVANGYYWQRGATGAGVRTSINRTTNPITVTPKGNGNYDALISGYGSMVRTFDAGTTFLLTVNNGNGNQASSIVTHLGDPDRFVVTDQSCVNCHGDRVFREPEGAEATEHHGVSPRGVQACVVCHNRFDTIGPGLGAAVTDGGTAIGGGTRLMGYVHGIHNSKNMPGGPVALRVDPDRFSSSNNGPLPEQWLNVTAPAGTYVRAVSAVLDAGVQITSAFSIGFPSYTTNCSTCHNTAEALSRVNAAPPSWALCMSCHQSWAGFKNPAVPTLHSAITAATVTATTCSGVCHTAGGVSTKTTVADFHNGRRTDRGGLIWDGDDQSVEQGKTVRMAITGTSVVGPNLAITWTAERNLAGVWTPVNPCNTDFMSGPVFFGTTGTTNPDAGVVAGNMSILRAYAQANDWVNEGQGTAPGQPASAVNVTSTNTSCAANVATTTVPSHTTTATLGIVALQGKPQVRFPPAAGTNSEFIQIRSSSPVWEFNPATGAAATVKRRDVADIARCSTCHEGSMYQHGGNRVDSIDLCQMCHNPAANEKSNRVGVFGVNAAAAYDGKVGESFDLRNMIHGIHSSGETGMPMVFYRTNGIYFFGSQEALARSTNWPTTDAPGDGVNCRPVAGATALLSDGGIPRWSGCTTPYAQKHNFIEVHYPRSLADCSACHVPGTVSTPPDPRMAVGLTVDPGAGPGAAWSNLLDDTLIGPTAASCMSCHQSGDPLKQYYQRSHAYNFGFPPSVFAGLGRQALLDAAANPGSGGPTEQCAGCHRDLEAKHATRGIISTSGISLTP